MGIDSTKSEIHLACEDDIDDVLRVKLKNALTQLGAVLISKREGFAGIVDYCIYKYLIHDEFIEIFNEAYRGVTIHGNAIILEKFMHEYNLSHYPEEGFQ